MPKAPTNEQNEVVQSILETTERMNELMEKAEDLGLKVNVNPTKINFPGKKDVRQIHVNVAMMLGESIAGGNR